VIVLAAPKTARAVAIGRCGRMRFMVAVSVGHFAVLCCYQKAAAWGRVVFGAAAFGLDSAPDNNRKSLQNAKSPSRQIKKNIPLLEEGRQKLKREASYQ